MTARVSIVADVMLVDRCNRGEETATRQLFRSYHKRVHATLYRILGASQDIDDLTQDAFIQVFKSLPSFRGDASLATWIDRITVRVAYRYIAKRSKLPTPDDELVGAALAPGPGPSQEAHSREGVRRLYAALATLPPAARVAFALHEIDGRSVREVANLLGANVSACKLRIWRARKALRSHASADPILAEFLEQAKGSPS